MQTRILSVVVVCLSVMGGAQAQERNRPSNEITAKRQRQLDALNALRVVNTAEAMHHAAVGKYVKFSELVLTAAWKDANRERVKGAPEWEAFLQGFDLQLTTDGDTYAIALTDRTDPCGFTVFTTNVGIAYTGYPIGSPISYRPQVCKYDR